MPIVRIELWPGKTQEIKDAVAKDVTEALVKHTGCPANAVTIVFDERIKSNWYTGGISHEELKKS